VKAAFWAFVYKLWLPWKHTLVIKDFF